MSDDRLLKIWERMANSLESIAASLERSSQPHMMHDVTPVLAATPKAGHDRAETGLPPAACGSVAHFLATKDFKIRSDPQACTADNCSDALDRLSLFLGERYSVLGNILQTIKRNMQNGSGFTIKIGHLPGQDITTICQFCSRLHKDFAFLGDYKYLKSPKFVIHARTAQHPKALRFLSGQWLERFVLAKLKSAYGTVRQELGRPVPFDCRSNVLVTLPDGKEFEMDVVALAGDIPIWIETKSGNYQQYLPKYSDIAQQLELDARHAILVVASIADGTRDTLSALYSLTIRALNDFEPFIIHLLRDELASAEMESHPDQHLNNRPNPDGTPALDQNPGNSGV